MVERDPYDVTLPELLNQYRYARGPGSRLQGTGKYQVRAVWGLRSPTPRLVHCGDFGESVAHIFGAMACLAFAFPIQLISVPPECRVRSIAPRILLSCSLMWKR